MAVELSYKILADASQARGEMAKFGRETATQTGRISGQLNKLGNMFKSVFGLIAIRELTKFGKDLYVTGKEVQAWGLMQEQVFGDGAKEIELWAEANRRAFGIGQEELEGYLGKTGNLLKNLGLTSDEVVGYSKRIGEAAGAASLLSGGTIDMGQAVHAFGRAVVGERDPIEALGVSLKQHQIDAYLAANEMGNLTGAELTAAEAIAGLEIAFEQLQPQMEEAKNVSGTAALSMASDWATLKEDIGVKVFEIGNAVAAGLFDFLEGEGDSFWATFGARFDDGWDELTAGADVFRQSWEAGWNQTEEQWTGGWAHAVATFAGFMRQVWEGMVWVAKGAWWLGEQIVKALSWAWDFATGMFDGLAAEAGNLPLIGRFLAGGGSVNSGQPVVVGERGPELFIPPSSGRIANSAAQAGGGGGGAGNTYNVTVVASAVSAVDVGEEVVRAIRAYEQVSGTGWRAA